MTEIVLMAHVLFGMLCMAGGVWLFVDVLHANEANQGRIRTMSIAVAILMGLAYLVGGYWYLTFYAADKAIILKGPWPFAHSFFMEMKEHVATMLLLLVTYLPGDGCGYLRKLSRRGGWDKLWFSLLSRSPRRASDRAGSGLWAIGG